MCEWLSNGVRRWRCRLLAIAILCLSATIGWTDEESPTPVAENSDDAATEKTDEKPSKSDVPSLDDELPTDELEINKPRFLDGESDDLADALDPTKRDPLEEARQQLDDAVESMRNAKDRLASSDTGDETRKLQEKAADNLQKILDLLQNPPPPPPQSQNQQQNQSQKNQNQQNQQSNSNQKKSGSSRQQQQGGGRSQKRRQGQRQKGRGSQQQGQARQQPMGAQPQPEQSGERSEKANESQDRNDPGKQREAEEDKRRELANDVWGHLPPNVREALQKSFNERYLPKYEDLVRKYYESLAEKGR